MDKELQQEIKDMPDGYFLNERKKWEKDRKKLLFYQKYFNDTEQYDVTQNAKLKLKMRLRQLDGK